MQCVRQRSTPSPTGTGWRRSGRLASSLLLAALVLLPTTGQAAEEHDLTLPSYEKVMVGGKPVAQFTLDGMKRILLIHEHLEFYREQGRLVEERAHLQQLRADNLAAQLSLANENRDLIQRRLDEQTKRIDGLIAEKNEHKYKRRWALFGTSLSVGGLVAACALTYAVVKD